MKFAIGVDFGTLSGRVVLVEVSSGKEVATAVYEYHNGVIDEYLPDTHIRLGARLGAAGSQ
jgi:L-ribulokinase